MRTQKVVEAMTQLRSFDYTRRHPADRQRQRARMIGLALAAITLAIALLG